MWRWKVKGQSCGQETKVRHHQVLWFLLKAFPQFTATVEGVSNVTSISGPKRVFSDPPRQGTTCHHPLPSLHRAHHAQWWQWGTEGAATEGVSDFMCPAQCYSLPRLCVRGCRLTWLTTGESHLHGSMYIYTYVAIHSSRIAEQSHSVCAFTPDTDVGKVY